MGTLLNGLDSVVMPLAMEVSIVLTSSGIKQVVVCDCVVTLLLGDVHKDILIGSRNV